MFGSYNDTLSYSSLWDYSDLSEAERLKDMQKHIWKFFCEDLAGFGLVEREGQQDMALDIGDAIGNKHHLIVEAGVGIGKSFAYIVPLLLFHKQFEQPIIISTSTITLQEQLVGDIEYVSDKIKYPVQVVVAKGQTHYICLKRVDELRDIALKERIFSKTAERCVERKDFASIVTNEQWNGIRIVNYGRKTCENCMHSSRCHFIWLRKEMRETDQFVICNHDLLTVHLQKIISGTNGLLPDSSPILVVDEAHNLEEKVRSSLTMRHTKHSFMGIVDSAVNPLDRSGTNIDEKVNALKNGFSKLFTLLNAQVTAQIIDKSEQVDTGRFFFEKTNEISGIITSISDLLEQLSEQVQIQIARLENERFGRHISEQTEYAVDELVYLAERFGQLLEKPTPNKLEKFFANTVI